MDEPDESHSQALLEKSANCLDDFLVSYTPDKKGILLEPEGEELAVFNCSIPQMRGWPKPFLYRTELLWKEGYGKYSVIDLRWLKSPTEFTTERKRTIIFPTEAYEKNGCEDPRVTVIDNLFYITYVAYDGTNSRVALATTENFNEIKKFGVISPEIPLEEAIEIVEEESYKDEWARELSNKAQERKFPMDKDAFIIKRNKYELYHRLGNCMQVAEVDDLKQLQNQDFWRAYLKNINEHTKMRNTAPWISERWASKKIGWGSEFFEVGDKVVEVWHGVDEIDESLVYSCSFLEEKDGEIVSILRNPLFVPSEEDFFCYNDNEKMKVKRVMFVTSAIVADNSDQIYFYYGSGDKRIGYYATNKHWLYRELNHSHNRLQVT